MIWDLTREEWEIGLKDRYAVVNILDMLLYILEVDPGCYVEMVSVSE